ncbi:MAG: hypothetical protein WBL67_12335 [Nitrososphaeraceae archaeon]
MSKFLRYTGHDLPSLEDKIRKLTSDVTELEFRKKDLNNHHYVTERTVI